MIERPPRLSRLYDAFVAEEVASVVRHQVRNRLATIRNAAHYVRRRVDGTGIGTTDPRVPSFLALIEDEVAQADEFLTRTLVRADQSAAGPVAFDALALATDVVDSFDPGAGVTIARVESAPARARGPMAEIELALSCILQNAIEAVDEEGGGVRIRVSREPAWVAIVVEDDGPGFGTGTLEHAARPFFTTKPGHLGLGLSIATRIARRAGGKVELAPGSTGGARATLSVPAAEPLRAAEPAVDPAPRILLVDDNEPARISLAAILEDSGALVTEAASLAEARARVRGADGFDLVILDVQLGDGLGTELIPDLRRRFPVATIAILSGSPADDGVGEADLVLAKAADPNAILAEFHHALRKEVPLGNARVAQG